nr:unnamed protein product [Digitaria exilis]
MANRKAPIAAAILCLCFVRAQCDHSPEQEQEIQMLKSKVASLEDEISRRKEETSQLESVVRERTAQMVALVGELELLQKVNVADDESVIKANTNVDMLEEQIDRLGNDLEDQVRKGESLEARATEAEKRLHEFSRKLDHAESINVEQRMKIRDLDDKLQDAQDKISELENEAKLKAEELAMVSISELFMARGFHIGLQYVSFAEVASAKWQVDGKPVFDPLVQKAAGKWTYAQQLVEPRLQTAHNKWVPVAKDHLQFLRNTTSLYASAVSKRSSAVYRVCRDATQPYTVKAGEFAVHCWQEWKTFTQPYVSQIVAASEPHLSRATMVIEPYIKPVTSGWRRFVSLTSEYHHKVKNGVEGFLEESRLVTPLPADKVAWLTVGSRVVYVISGAQARRGSDTHQSRLQASALFTLPVISIYKALSATIRKKIQARKDGGSNRKNKRSSRQAEKPLERAT